MSVLRGVGVGAGYFSQFHYEAWNRMPDVAIVALAEVDAERGQTAQEQYGIPNLYADVQAMLKAEQPDFIDIITPPATHLALCRAAAAQGVAIICQKPLAPTLAASQAIVEVAQQAGVPLMVHENFRWQPWYREIKRLIETDVLGEVFHIYFQARPGDGWPEDAYLSRQPFFRDYERLLIYETGVHWIDTFRFLLGDMSTVYAQLRRHNPGIKGEDAGQLFFTFQTGATAIWDANRYNENEATNPRYTFGEMRIDASKGHLTLGYDGRIRIKLLGQPAYDHDYEHADVNFASDCVYMTQRHFVETLQTGSAFETSGQDYLHNVRAVEAAYESAESGLPVKLT